MSATKRHNPAKYDRMREAIEQSRERKRLLEAADEKASRVYAKISGIVQRRSEKLGSPVHAVFEFCPSEKFKRGGHRGSMIRAARLVWTLTNELDFPIRLEFEHVPLDRPKGLLSISEGPHRHRDYSLPPARTTFDWEPGIDRLRHTSDPIEEEVAARIRACSERVGDWRVAHHPQCASRNPVLKLVRRTPAGEIVHPLGECDCNFQLLRRKGTITFSVERDGSESVVHLPALTRARVRFVDPDRVEQAGDEAGFPGEFATDSSGLALIPWDRPFVEFGDGIISFADAGLPRKRTPRAPQ